MQSGQVKTLQPRKKEVVEKMWEPQSHSSLFSAGEEPLCGMGHTQVSMAVTNMDSVRNLCGVRRFCHTSPGKEKARVKPCFLFKGSAFGDRGFRVGWGLVYQYLVSVFLKFISSTLVPNSEIRSVKP